MNLPRLVALHLADHIDDLAYVEGSAAGGNLFLAHMPDQPDTAAMVNGTGGPTSSTKTGFDSRTFQVIVRGSIDPNVGSDLGEEIYGALHGLRNVALADGTWLVHCEGIQSAPTSLGEDTKGRHEYTLNFLAEVRNPTAYRHE